MAAVPNLSAASDDAFRDLLNPAFRERCVACHGAAGKPSGGVNLAALESHVDLDADPELVRDLVNALDSGLMPPRGAPPLPGEQREELVAELRRVLHRAARSLEAYPRTPIRRMNRFQYNNAVQDLFELKVDVFALPERMLRDYDYFHPGTGKMPAQLKAGSRPLGKSQLIDRRLAGVAPFPQDLRAEHGFDNRGDHLTLSPLLLESFLKLSRSIVESEDFNSLTVGVWDRLFLPPTEAGEIEPAVRESLRGFLTRAFRRTVSDDLLARYTDHATARIVDGASYAEGMKAAVSAALASPRFLYLYEHGGLGRERVDDFELASRLSFFLWGGLPDRQLLHLAADRKLGDDQVLAAQVDRMLDDVRLKRFCDSFAPQWLQLERIVSSVPDPDRYPDFYFAKFRMSMHMMMEPLLLFETVLVEDRSILELIDPDFSYRSEALASWYRDGTRPAKVPPTAVPFKRVALADRREGGVITNAAVMTMTSNPVRTQPVTRGAWLASVIFNDPPDPPPASVPPLPEDGDESVDPDQTLRERFEAHRSDPGCAGCHAKIDPLGFALEHFGPTGVWRDQYANGREVDSSGVLFGRHEFTDVVEFKDAVLAEKERFARAFAAHLLSFALGREVAVTDEPAIDRIVRATAAEDFPLRAMIRQVVLSEPFRTKYNPEQRPAKPRRQAAH